MGMRLNQMRILQAVAGSIALGVGSRSRTSCVLSLVYTVYTPSLHTLTAIFVSASKVGKTSTRAWSVGQVAVDGHSDLSTAVCPPKR